MTSLKGYIPALARLVGTTPAALYERQRALVRAGLLDQSEGRGPGSGVRATAPSVALLLISVLASENLSDTEARVRAIAEAHPSGRQRCPYTKRTNFLDALAAILVGTGAAAGVTDISVSRTAARARIGYWDGPGNEKIAEFAGNPAAETGIAVTATLPKNLLQSIAGDVHAMVIETFDSIEDIERRTS